MSELVIEPSVGHAGGESTLERGERSALFSDAIDNKWVSETVGSFNSVGNIGLCRTIKINDREGEMVSCESVIESLWFQHIKPLFLVTLKYVKGNVFSFCPALQLGLVGDHVTTLYSWLCGNLRLGDDLVLGEVRG